jgi:hypothetical protein
MGMSTTIKPAIDNTIMIIVVADRAGSDDDVIAVPDVLDPPMVPSCDELPVVPAANLFSHHS